MRCNFQCVNHLIKNFHSFKNWCLFNVKNMDQEKKRTLYIAFPDIPVYLHPRSASQHTNSTSFSSLSRYMRDTYDIILFEPRLDNQLHRSSYIQSAVESQKLIRELPTLNGGFSLCHSSHFLQGGDPLATMENSNILTGKSMKNLDMRRGVCVYLDRDTDDLDKKEKIITIAKNIGFHSYFTLKFKSGTSREVKVEEYGMNGSLLQIEDFILKRKSVSNDVSYIFQYDNYMPVFHSFQAALEVLYKTDPEKYIMIDELIKRAKEFISTEFTPEKLREKMKYPFVVVEGMDAAGKTTLTKSLEKKLNAARFYTPPLEIEELRSFFDTLPEIVRRAYYSVGNYIVAMEISHACMERPVIMDRYWHSTAAYAIANETSSGDLPDANHTAYIWPSDLLKPDVVLFLTVSEDVRKHRMEDRGGVKTFEEKYLDKDKLFRERLCTAYRRMQNPSVVEIDACGTKEEVFQEAIAILRDHGISLKMASDLWI